MLGPFFLFLVIFDQSFKKVQHTGVLFSEVPVEPADFIVLAIGVVIAELGAAHFIAHQQHGRSLG